VKYAITPTDRQAVGLWQVLALTALLLLSAGCNQSGSSATAALLPDRPDCLPNLTLTDKFGHPINLMSLRGKPLLLGFSYLLGDPSHLIMYLKSLSSARMAICSTNICTTPTLCESLAT
jgi:hypothetical protein